MKAGLSLRMSQHLALTPQLQQSIRLLQLSTLELQQEIEQMLDDNPFLEANPDEAPQEALGLAQDDAHVSLGDRLSEQAELGGSEDAPDSGADEVVSGVAESWEGDGSLEMNAHDSEWGGDAMPAQADPEDDLASAIELARSAPSLAEALLQQARCLRLSALDRAALEFLIGSLDDDGYLADSIEDLAASLAGDDLEAREALQERFVMALHLLQSMTPTGVGARDLQECLLLQLRERQGAQAHDPAVAAALALVRCDMALLARRDMRKLAQQAGLSDAQVRLGLQCIGGLEPKPGRAFVDVERQIVVPDVIVSPQGRSPGRFRVQLNPDVMPRLRVNDIYAQVLRGHKGEAVQGLQQRLQEARWFIKNIQQRFDTILRVSRAIVERQKQFLQHGELAMRPLVLREIADELGLHESTISRVTTAKYMATPQGTFELKYFFGSGLGTDSGSATSSTAVRALIRQFISAENPARPLSDNQLADMLKEQGIDCARRTVAKYREALKIAPANLRKAL